MCAVSETPAGNGCATSFTALAINTGGNTEELWTNTIHTKSRNPYFCAFGRFEGVPIKNTHIVGWDEAGVRGGGSLAGGGGVAPPGPSLSRQPGVRWLRSTLLYSCSTVARRDRGISLRKHGGTSLLHLSRSATVVHTFYAGVARSRSGSSSFTASALNKPPPPPPPPPPLIVHKNGLGNLRPNLTLMNLNMKPVQVATSSESDN